MKVMIDVFAAIRGRAGKRVRGALLATVLLTGLAAPLVVAPAPAYAAGGSWDDSGPGTGGSGSIDDPSGGGSGFHCRGLQLYAGSGKKWYDGVYPNCTGPKHTFTGKIKLCPVGFTVFRFYGTYANPTQAYTVNDLQLPDWCQFESTYTFWGANPSDYNGKTPGSPWYTRVADNPSGKYIGGGHFSTVGRTEFGRLSAGVPYSASGNCANAQTEPNPIAAHLSDSKVTTESKQQTARLFYDAYLQLSRNGKYPKTALSMLGLSTIKRASNGNVTMTFDKRPCSSPMDFISTADMDNIAKKAEQAKFKVTGTCYIPVDRMAFYFDKNSGAGGAWAYPSVHRAPLGGLRYSNYYGTSAHTAAKPRGVNGGAANTYEQKVLSGWRNTMFNWYKAQPSFTGDNQTLPAEPYVVKGSDRTPTGDKQGFDRNAAGKALRDQSRCRFASQVSFDYSTDGARPSAGLNLKMTNQELFQSGGMNRVQQVTVAREAIKCVGGAKVCQNANVKLSQLAYNVTVTSTDAKYRQCTGATTTNCDFKVISTTARKGPIQPDTTVRVVFFNPTMPTQKVKFSISNLSAKYTYQAVVGGLEMNVEDPISGTPVKFGSRGGYAPFEGTLTPTATGAPMKLTKSGSTYSYTAPVIGAVGNTLD